MIVNAGLAGPHRIPRVVLLVVVEQHHVALYAGGVELEHVGGAAIVIAVEADGDRVGGDIDVAARERAADAMRFRVVGPHADVQRLVVVEHRELRLDVGLRAVLREPLREAALPRRALPRSLVEVTVDRDRAGAAHGVRTHGGR